MQSPLHPTFRIKLVKACENTGRGPSTLPCWTSSSREKICFSNNKPSFFQLFQSGEVGGSNVTVENFIIHPGSELATRYFLRIIQRIRMETE